MMTTTTTSAAIYAGDWGDERRSVGARIEAPPAQKFSIFELEKVSFGAFWVLLLQLN